MIGRRNPSEYKKIVAIVKSDMYTGKKRLTPAPDQPFPEHMYIECSKELRRLPIGTKVLLSVVEKNPKDNHDAKHLYCSYKSDYEIL